MDSEPPPVADPYLPRDKHEFALALDWRLRQLGMTQAELARRLSTRSGTVNGWGKGHRMPTTRRLVSGLMEVTGIAAPSDPELARRARVDLEERVGVLEYAVSELLVALREREADGTRSAEAIENATAAMGAAAPDPAPSPRRVRRPARKDQ